MNIYLLRHGETEENKNKFYYGKLDVSLNQTGRSQIEAVKGTMQSINFQKVYISQRKRTMETAEIVMADKFVEFIADKRINEMDFGAFEGKTYEQIKSLYPKEYEQWGKDWKNFCPPQGESYKEFYSRIHDFMEDIKKLEQENILIVTHGGVIRTIYCYVLGGNLDNFWRFSSKNADISLIKYEYDNFFIDSITHVK
jgi:alpha-ribazole phosphatase